MILRICWAWRSSPTPKPSTPALLLMIVSPFAPFRCNARVRFSGIPHRPNPPTMIVAPSCRSAIASNALGTTLFMGLSRNGAVGSVEDLLDLLHISGFQRVEHGAQARGE